jgi:pimeloyl-ACP methyl ester carboxylesterase
MKQSTIISTAALTVALAGSAVFNVIRARSAEKKTPPEGKFIEVDGVRLHYIEKGSGPPLILLHGNGAMLQDYELSGLIGEAAKQYRIIAFDRPGFGYSERPRSTVWTPVNQARLIFKAAQMLGVQKPVILGHSWGTLVALAAALDHPSDVAGLVLLSGYYFPSVRPDVVLFSPPAIPGIGDILRFTASPLMGRVTAPGMFKAMFAPARVPERFARWPVDLALRPSQLRAAAADTAMMIPAAALLQKRYGELHLPVAIMAGEGDKIAHFDEQSCVLHQKLSNSELVTIPHEGHMFHYTAGESILAAIGRVFSRSGKALEPSTAVADEIIPAPPVHSL